MKNTARLSELRKALPDIALLGKVRTGGLLRQIRQLAGEINLYHKYFRGAAALWSGTAVLKLPTTAVDVTAASLNAAAAGTAKHLFALWVADGFGDACLLIDGIGPTLTPAEAVTDAEVGTPTITGTPKFDKGRVLVEVVFDTDAGATKTYAAADAVTVDCDLTLAGVALGQVTMTFDIV